MSTVAIILQVLLALGFLGTGVPKLASAKSSLVQRDRLRVAPWFWQLTGLLETLGALGMLAGIFVAPIAAIAGIWVAVIMVGAIGTHLLHRDSVSHFAAPVMLLVLAVVVAVAQWSALGVNLG